MNKKLLIASVCLLSLLGNITAQEKNETKDVKVTVKKDKKGTVVHKTITVNGKKVEDSNENTDVTIDDGDEKKMDKKIKSINKKIKIISDDNEEETTSRNHQPKTKKQAKVFVNGAEMNDDENDHPQQKRMTVIVDGDNVTINGKPVEDMNDDEIKVLRGKANHLKMIAPMLRGGKMFNIPPPPAMEDEMEGEPNVGNFRNHFLQQLDANATNANKALLGVVTNKENEGAKITNISKESAAEKAGLQQGDIITKINEDKITSNQDLIKTIGKYNPQDKINITYLRDKKTKTTDATLTKNEERNARVFCWNNSDAPMEITEDFNGGDEFSFEGFMHNKKPKIGATVQDVEEGNGVKIIEVQPETPAAKAGLQKEDIVVEINNEVLKNVDDLKSKLDQVKEGEMYKIKYMRNGVLQNAEVKFPKKLKTANL